MDNAVLHPSTRALFDALRTNPPQALLLSGPEGVGKRHIAQLWASQFSDLPQLVEATEKKGISIAQIRELYQQTRAKQSAPRYFILAEADNMSAGAQNAFLKLLEEPNNAVYFILTAANPSLLLPTIHSRLQHIPIAPVGDQAIHDFVQQFSPDQSALPQLLFIARGRVGLSHQLATDTTVFRAHRQLATDAKQLLTGTSFERLKLLSAFTDRQQAMEFLDIAANMASMLLQRSTDSTEQQRWITRLTLLDATAERLHAQGNLKLQLTRMALQL